MASIRQLEANRRNALRSTGPRTATGRATSSRNATKHGLLSRQTVLPDEDRAEYERLREQLLDSLAPEDGVEEALADSAVQLVWRLARLGRVEAGLFLVGMHTPIGEAIREDSTDVGQLAWAFSGQSNAFGVLSRYEAGLTRSLQRLLADYEAARQRRRSTIETPAATLKAV